MDTVDNLALNIPEASKKELLKQGKISAFCIQTQVFLQRLQFELALWTVFRDNSIMTIYVQNWRQKNGYQTSSSNERAAGACS